jgi:predicted metal-dependent peptidase
MAKTISAPTRTAEEVIEQARSDLITEHIFFGYLVSKLKIVEDVMCPTAWTDGVSIGYNPEFVRGLKRSEAKTLFAHEVAHCFLGHQWRRGTRESGRWNIACDHASNLILKDSGFAPISDWYCDSKYSGWNAERIYSDLTEEKEEEKQQSPEGEESPSESSPASPPKPKNQPKPDEQAEQPDSGGSTGEEGEEPSPVPYSGPAPGTPGGPNPLGEVRDAPVGGEEPPAPESEWTMEAVRAADFAKSAGKLGSYVQGIVAKLKEPEIHWAEVLHKWLQEKTNEDYSYGRLNKKFIAHNLIMPSLYSEQMGKLVLVMDVSGSVSQGEFEACATEIVAAIDQCNPLETHIIQFDAPADYRNPLSAIRDHQILDKGDDIKQVERKGSGGTMFSPVFQYIEEQDIQPAALVFLTDMGNFGDWPAEPEYPVLWVSTTPEVKEPFGDIIYLLDGGRTR